MESHINSRELPTFTSHNFTSQNSVEEFSLFTDAFYEGMTMGMLKRTHFQKCGDTVEKRIYEKGETPDNFKSRGTQSDTNPGLCPNCEKKQKERV